MTLGYLDLFKGKVNFIPLGLWIGNAAKVHFSVSVILCDMPSQLTSISWNSKGQGHLVPFAIWLDYFGVLSL